MTPSFKRTLTVIAVVFVLFALLAKAVQTGNQVHAEQDAADHALTESGR
jgi:hypothetical protein